MLLSAVIPLIAVAQAACGLEVCPIEAPGADSPEIAQLRLAPRYTASPDGAAWYAELFLGGHLRIGEHFRFGMSAPLVLVRDPFGHQPAVGNVVGFVDAQRRGDSLSVGGGLQAELPTSTREVDDGHLVLLPYARAQLWVGAADLRVRGGWGLTLDEGDDHSEGHSEGHSHDAGLTPAVEVNPHADSELMLIAELGRSWRLPELILRPALSLSAWQALNAASSSALAAAPSTALAAGPSLELRAGQVLLRLQGEAALTEARRFDHRLTASISVDVPHPRETPT